MKKTILPILSLLPMMAQAASESRPNIVLILADDMGYSDLGCYGGEIHTPNLDALARGGMRYRQFYNGARSCPTRASLLTGLYAHQAGIGWMTASDMGRPAYQGYLNRECVTLAEVLREAGYATYMSGKWHVAQERQNKAKLKEFWPNERGFDEFFGIVEGASNYYTPLLNHNEEQYQQPYDPDFYLTHALTDSASSYIRHHDYGERPLFLYLSYNAPHWPLHALPEDIDRYREVYKRGWDRLRAERFARQQRMGLFRASDVSSDRDPDIPAWDSLTPAQQEEFAARMAIYAAQVDAMDQGIGRVVKALREKGQLDNTIILFLSDNGACAEYISDGPRRELDGRHDTYESYRRNWANLSSTPYKEYKHHTNEGGIATPMIVHYPKGMSKKMRGKWSPEFGHIIDIMPTFVALANAEYPTQYKGHRIQPMEGVSLLPHLQGQTTGRGQVFWEHEANIGVRDGKWKIVTKTLEDHPYEEDSIRLYDMEADPTELHDLAATYPELKARLYADWTRWAERVNALPLDTRGYGLRQQDFRRDKMNGNFEAVLADWDLHSEAPAQVRFDIDPVNGINGNTAHISIAQTGQRPAHAYMKWGFSGRKDEQVTVSFTIRSSEDTNIKCRLEHQREVTYKPIDQSVDLKAGALQKLTFTSSPLRERAPYQWVFYVGEAKGEIWIDDVTMTYSK